MRTILFIIFALLFYPLVASLFASTWEAGSGEEVRVKAVFHILARPGGSAAELEVVSLGRLDDYIERNTNVNFSDVPASGVLVEGEGDRFTYDTQRSIDGALVVDINWAGDDYSGRSRYRVDGNTVTPLAHEFNHGMMIMASFVVAGFSAYILSLLVTPLALRGSRCCALTAKVVSVRERLIPARHIQNRIRQVTRLSTVVYLWPAATLVWFTCRDIHDMEGLFLVGGINLVCIALMFLLARGVYRFQHNALVLHGLIVAAMIFALAAMLD